MGFARKSLLAAVAVLSAVAAPIAAAQEPGFEATLPSPDRPALLLADEIVYDREAEVVVAAGHVEVSQDNRVVLADRLTYDLRQGVVVAEGHVAVVEPTGEVLFADEVVLSDDLRQAVAEEIGVLLQENARFAAESGRKQGDIVRLDRAVYSPCDVCDEEGAMPLWRIKALEVVHDRNAGNIYYHNAWLEVLGIPVAYTPYFMHPDPTVERRSGFLAPVIGRGEDLGTTIQIPYYYVISPYQDVTLTPMITTGEGLVMIGEHRKRFTNGLTDTEGSITEEADGDIRGHIDADGDFHLTEKWRAGYQVERATDDTYLRRYGFDLGETWLTTRPYAVGLTSRSYTSVEAYLLQSLRRETDDEELPIVLPWATYNYVGERGMWGGQWSVDASALALTRVQGRDTRRLSARLGWDRRFVTSGGQVFELGLSVRGDGYHTNQPNADADTIGRFIPEASLQWRYPFYAAGNTYRHVVEPVVLGVASLNSLNPADIPNEDSIDLVFDESNLFSTNRFTGLDRVEEGLRVNYGLRYTISGQGLYASAVVGQVYRGQDNADYPPGSGLNEHFSDYVGRFSLQYEDVLDLRYRVRLEKDRFDPRYNEFSTIVRMDPVRLRLDYIYADELQQEGLGVREEVSAQFDAVFYDYWTASAYTRYDIADGSQPLVTGVALGYEDECFAIIASWEDDRTNDRDYNAGQRYGLRFVFKTLGEVGL